MTLQDVVLLDKDERVVPGKVRLKNGVIQCRWADDGAKAVSLRWDAGRAGACSLRTCLLAQRSEPYLLCVELARHRIGTFAFKAEEWQMSSRLDATHPAMQCWERARSLFTNAMVISDPAKAQQFAQRSLSLAIEATERLAMAYAEAQLKIRFATKPLPSTALGTRVPLMEVDDAARSVVLKDMPLITVPLSWSALCDEQGQYDWSGPDAWIGWAIDHGCRVLTGPLLDLSPGGVPPWVRHRLDAGVSLDDVAWDHVHAVVNRYGPHVGMWCVGTGLNSNAEVDLSTDEMVNLVRSTALCIREGGRGRRVVVEIDQPWSEHLCDGPSGIDPLQFVDHVQQRGVRLDAVGLRIRMGDGHSGRSVRDLMEISRMVDRYFLLDVPILISRLGVPDQAELDGGRWRERDWNPETQAKWAARAVLLLIAKRHVQSVIWTDLIDNPQTCPPGGGLMQADGTAKMVLNRLQSLVRQLRTNKAGGDDT